MRAWILAAVMLGAVAIFFALRQGRLSSEVASLRLTNEELAGRQQELIERIERAEAKLTAQAEAGPSVTAFPSADNSQLSRRVTALEHQLRSLRALFPAEYDPTVAAIEPEPLTNATPKRNWGPEQATGAPDTEREGDMVTAWTSLDPDGGPEWLAVGFDKAVEIAQVRIRESYNAGGITKVATVVNGIEVVLWEGTSAGGKAPRDFVVPVSGSVMANSVVIYVDTKRVVGWNEIDAVELIGRDGSRQWASSANASSTYADRATAQVRQFNDFGTTILR